MTEGYDEFETAALQANNPLWKLAEPQRKRLIGRVRNVVHGMANVGGDRHNNMREARQQIKETASAESAIDLMGQTQFNDFVKWAYLRAERENAS
jgi:hypothetical protein